MSTNVKKCKYKNASQLPRLAILKYESTTRDNHDITSTKRHRQPPPRART